jgi:putative redox protein
MPQERAVRLEWTGQGLRFRGGGTEPATPEIVIDGDGEQGPSPMLSLLLAAAGCSGADVVVILNKMRVPIERLAIEVVGVRRDEEPRRYTGLKFRFTVSGNEIDVPKVERAVELSLEKYCSVVASLAPDVAVGYEVAVE